MSTPKGHPPVTGTSGPLGSAVRKQAAAGRRGLVRAQADTDALGGKPLPATSLIRTRSPSRSRDVYAAVHSAATPGGPWSTAGEANFESVNHQGSIHVLDTQRSQGAPRPRRPVRQSHTFVTVIERTSVGAGQTRAFVVSTEQVGDVPRERAAGTRTARCTGSSPSTRTPRRTDPGFPPARATNLGAMKVFAEQNFLRPPDPAAINKALRDHAAPATQDVEGTVAWMHKEGLL